MKQCHFAKKNKENDSGNRDMKKIHHSIKQKGFLFIIEYWMPVCLVQIKAKQNFYSFIRNEIGTRVDILVIDVFSSPFY